jgi:hypothetical protein
LFSVQSSWLMPKGRVMAELPIKLCPTREAIFSAYEADSGDGFRSHLGASLIGKHCERALFYDFRWVTRAKHEGRLLRLFETGQLEESRLVLNLRRVGATVLEVDPDTGRQFRVQAHGGHFGGSLDGVAINLLEAPKTWHVLEFKTHSNKSFNELVAKTVRESKPQHFAQMQIYMHLMGMARAMYMAVNKDNDDLYIERVEVDTEYAKACWQKQNGSSLPKTHRHGYPMTPLGISAGCVTTRRFVTALHLGHRLPRSTAVPVCIQAQLRAAGSASTTKKN